MKTRPRKKMFDWIVTAIALSSLLNISSSSIANTHENFELMHLWIDKSEAAALAAIKKSVTNQGLTWQEHRVKGNFYGIRKRLAERLRFEIPPTSVFWIGGRDITNLIDTNIFRLLPKSAIDPRSWSTFLPEIRKILSYKGGITALPLGIHIQNHISYNKNIYKQLDLQIPKTWEQFLRDAPKIKAAGYAPLAMSDQAWQLRFLFVSILTAKLDSKAFKKFLSGQSADDNATREAIRKSFSILRQLSEFVSIDHHNLAWGNVVRKVKNKHAAAVVMGDFTSTLFSKSDQVTCGLPPGNKYLVWSFDVLAFPQTTNRHVLTNQDVAILAISSPSTQAEYISAKGGIPISMGVTAENLNFCSKIMFAQWLGDTEKIHIGATAWRTQLNKLGIIAQTFWRDRYQSPASATDVLLSHVTPLLNSE